ncbi:Tetratricopeptide repeat protein 1 [Spatholobus suberectus]|nr:Tetratricopeptide repeat protein 1 [Spatholobus suberectus]
MEYQLPQNPPIKANSRNSIPATPPHTNKCSCFFCIMSETVPPLRRAKIARYFKQMPLRDDQEHILALSGLWKIAVTNPNDPEFPSLGIFRCMAKLTQKGVNHKDWLLRCQNIYIPYYAAHIIGSYTMNKPKFADKAVKSNVVQPLMELLRGKVSWVEQRVALRALGHIASHEATFEAVAEHEAEVIEAATGIASTCLKEVYEKFVGLKESERLEYHRNLLTRGHGDLELENRKAEEWASQLQCWSLYLLDCFACRERSLGLICKKQFLKDLCGMWGGLSNPTSPAGIGLLRTLCHTQIGRESVADLEEVVVNLCNVSRSSDERQHMAIDSLLQLLRDSVTRYKVIDIAVPALADLVELRSMGGKPKVGQAIMQTLLQDYHKIRFGELKLKSEKTKRTLKELWDLKVERVKRESLMSEQEIREKQVLAGILKQEGNREFGSGDIEKAVAKYAEALDLCPLKTKKERIVLHSNRAQCHLLLRDPEAALSDATRALCLSNVASACLHSKSLWRRSQAYDMKGLAKESLMDCFMFISNRLGSRQTNGFKIPHYAARMVNKQMNATWIFASAQSSWHGTREEVKELVVQNKIDSLKLRKKTRRRTSKGEW